MTERLSKAVRRTLTLSVLALLPVSQSACADQADRPASSLQLTRVHVPAMDADSLSSPSASWNDIDADGDPDLYVLNGFATLAAERTRQPDRLYRNDQGTLTRLPDRALVETPAFSGSAVWADYDNDGDDDVFVANQQGDDNRLYRNDDGAFTAMDGPWVGAGGRSFSAAWVDIDGDGRLDLHVFNGRDGDGGQQDFFYRNTGHGFEAVEDLPFLADALPSGGGAWADYDADGDPDLFLPVHSDRQTSRLYRNDGDGRFAEVAAEAGLTADPLPYPPASSAARWVDYDADGDLDLFSGTAGTIDYLFRNDDGRFRRVAAGRVGLDATYVSDAVWADLDNDADLDLAIAVWGGGSEIYRNDGTGALYPVDAGDFGSVINFASSVSPADFDGDGDLDLFLTQWPINEAGGLPNQLYRNDTGGRWLEVALVGTASNRSGIGASITVVTEGDDGPRSQLRLVTSRTSWRSSGTLTRHFGLGSADAAERVVVRWPSGATDTVPGPIRANQRITITEGSPGG